MTIQQKLAAIAADLKLVHGVKKNYVCLQPSGVPAFFIPVDIFEDDHFVAIAKTPGNHVHHVIIPYSSFQGYMMPTESIINEIKLQEANLFSGKIIPARA